MLAKAFLRQEERERRKHQCLCRRNRGRRTTTRTRTICGGRMSNREYFGFDLLLFLVCPSFSWWWSSSSSVTDRCWLRRFYGEKRVNGGSNPCLCRRNRGRRTTPRTRTICGGESVIPRIFRL